MELDQQQASVLDALEFDLTVADSDTASITGGSEVSQRATHDFNRQIRTTMRTVMKRNVRKMVFCVRGIRGSCPFCLCGGPHTRGSASTEHLSWSAEFDEVDLREVFMLSPITMKSVPPFMRSCFTNAMRLACKTVVQG